MLRRLSLWLGAAAVTLAVLFVSVLIYKLIHAEPDTPEQVDCRLLDRHELANTGADVRLFHCRRGEKNNWEGLELWLYEANQEPSQRLVSAPLDACFQARVDRRDQLTLLHTVSRGELGISRSSVVYQGDAQGPYTLSIQTERVTDCSAELHHPFER
ncbi:hypothetical protein [Pseudidiomarina taiwanensis]|uniref:Uncharacterized protein n=1 Tax=Pseudidiomarina taiwanensis TaxID=337250 RepID=A0A432ZMS1_9GAMM|nr:hypothetical protein [Pseudidiomarina taiwanensis]RUO79168.1 hypothetical protein CWI83_01250 [Pseudidiomarina taiwanensis]